MCTPPGDTYTVAYAVGVAICGVLVLTFYGYIPDRPNVDLLWGGFAGHKLKFKVVSVVTATSFLVMYAYAIGYNLVTAELLASTFVFFVGACGWAIVAACTGDADFIPVHVHRLFVWITAVGSVAMAVTYIMATNCGHAPHKEIAQAAVIIVAIHHVVIDGVLWAVTLKGSRTLPVSMEMTAAALRTRL